MTKITSYRNLTTMFWHRSSSPRTQDFRLLGRIRGRAEKLKSLTDSELANESIRLREQLADGQKVNDQRTVVEAFALATDALRRVSGKVYYDVQLLGGLVLSAGSVAEMQTGEGKTITCALSAVLYGLSGEGAHVATTNDYLAQRDYQEVKPILELLGVSTGLIESGQSTEEKQAAYRCDVTYGTGYEFGFDFLRDQMAMRNRPELPLGTKFVAHLRGQVIRDLMLVQRHLAMSVVDEADSVLIDEATTPLILTGASNAKKPNPQIYFQAMAVANEMEVNASYTIDQISQKVELTKMGWKMAHQRLSPELQAKLVRPWILYVEQALQVRMTLTRDRDYVIQEGKVVFVDQNTGRLHADRKWRSGLHQAIETREGVPLTEEREVEARISRQRYYQFYRRISGMTGTAQGNEAELAEFYRLPVVKIPRNQPSRSIRLPSRFFSNKDAKFDAIAHDVFNRQQTGQPILVGTSSVAQSRELSERLRERGVSHSVLNGTQDGQEADLISRAGEAGRVMIATNMAGRGTDIRLDDAAREAGGLHVIAAEHQESARVDRQLTGRSARQNDPGSCQFFVSADDSILSQYKPALSRQIQRAAKRDGESKSNFETQIARLQIEIERIKFLARRKMVVYDNWMESVQESVAKSG